MFFPEKKGESNCLRFRRPFSISLQRSFTIRTTKILQPRQRAILWLLPLFSGYIPLPPISFLLFPVAYQVILFLGGLARDSHSSSLYRRVDRNFSFSSSLLSLAYCLRHSAVVQLWYSVPPVTQWRCRSQP